MRIWLIVLGVVALLGLGVWLYSSRPVEPAEPGSQTSTPVTPPSGQPSNPGSSSSSSPESTPKDISELLCLNTSDAPKPQPRRPTLLVMAACVELQGRVMFVSALPNTGDYLIKIWLTPRYSALREACRAVATEELQDLDRDMNATIAKEDWPKFSPILQPDGSGTPYKFATYQVTAQGVYVFSTETHPNQKIFGPHCEIHPLQKLELLEEKKEEGQ